MDVKEWSTVDGGDIVVWDFGGGNNQQWRLEVASTPSGECPGGWGLVKKFGFSSMDQVRFRHLSALAEYERVPCTGQQGLEHHIMATWFSE